MTTLSAETIQMIVYVVIFLAAVFSLALIGMLAGWFKSANQPTVIRFEQGSDFSTNGARLIDNPHKLRSARRSIKRTY